jgi:stringent starvation protein B
MSKPRFTVVIHCRDIRHTFTPMKPRAKRAFVKWLTESMRFPTIVVAHPNRGLIIPTSEVRYVEITPTSENGGAS